MGEFNAGDLTELDFDNFCKLNQIVIHILPNVGSSIKGFCYYDGEHYNVFLNNRFNHIQLKLTVIHEIIHVLDKHFTFSPYSLEECENNTKNIVNQLKTNFI